MEQEIQEIVRLSINKMADGVVFCREFAFFDNHRVFTRVTNLDTHESPVGWQACVDWADLEQVNILVQRMVAKGWEAVWNPNYTNVQGYSRSVSFS